MWEVLQRWQVEAYARVFLCGPYVAGLGQTFLSDLLSFLFSTCKKFYAHPGYGYTRKMKTQIHQ